MAELKRAQETYKLLLLAKEDIDKKLRAASPGIPGIENMIRNSGPVSQADNNNTGYATSTMRPIPVCLLVEIRDHMKQTHADMEKHACASAAYGMVPSHLSQTQYSSFVVGDPSRALGL